MAHGDPQARRRRVPRPSVEEERGRTARPDDGARRGSRVAQRRPGPAGDGAAAQDGTATLTVRLEHPVDPTSNMFQAIEGRWGSREVRNHRSGAASMHGQPSFVLHSGDAMAVRLKVRVRMRRTNDFVFGVSLFNADGVCCYGTNTYIEEMEPDRLSGERQSDVLWIESLDLVEGTYKLDAAVHKLRNGYPYDYHRLLYTFRVKSRVPRCQGHITVPHHKWTFSGGGLLSNRRLPAVGARPERMAVTPWPRPRRLPSAVACRRPAASSREQARLRSAPPGTRALPRRRRGGSETR